MTAKNIAAFIVLGIPALALIGIIVCGAIKICIEILKDE